jgi:hypothetical protein
MERVSQEETEGKIDGRDKGEEKTIKRRVAQLKRFGREKGSKEGSRGIEDRKDGNVWRSPLLLGTRY